MRHANTGSRFSSCDDDVTDFSAPLLDILFRTAYQLPSFLDGAGQFVDVPLHIALLIGEVRNV